jgi:mitochondrial inner membrane protease subunit 1
MRASDVQGMRAFLRFSFVGKERRFLFPHQKGKNNNTSACYCLYPSLRKTCDGFSIRTMLMDVHTRPSHSRMFVEETTSPPPQPPSSPPTWMEEWRLLRILIQRMAMALGMVHCWTEYVMDITLCSGPSMLPTIQEANELVCIDRFAVYRGSVHDGTTASSRIRAARQRQEKHSPIYIWHQPMIPVSELGPITWRQAWEHMRSPLLVGDVVVSQNPNRPGTICKRIVGLPGDRILLWNGDILVVPDHHVWLEGDNPSNSLDSRQSGPIPMALLRGRAVARLWPCRGQAWMRRGAPPMERQLPSSNGYEGGSIVLPAGYNGEHIVRHLAPSEILARQN